MNLIESVKKSYGSRKGFNKKKLIVAFILIAVGVLGRIARINFFPELYNVEPITLVALLAGAFLGFGYALMVPLVVIALTDMYIGNTSILYVTWSAWAIIGILGLILGKSKKSNFTFGFKMAGMGIIASAFFFIWTNFGVWILGSMYAHTWQGLVQCYVMALPFFKMNLFGNLVIVPVVSFSLVAGLRLWKVFIVGEDSKIKKSLVQ